MLRNLAALLLLLVTITTMAAPQKPLSADEAYKFSAYVKDPNTVVLSWNIKPSYYLYKDRFSYKIVTPESVTFGELQLPQGIAKHDELLGDYTAFKDQLNIEVPVNNPDQAKDLDFKVCYQGCSENGFCYPPTTKQVKLDLSDLDQTEVFATNPAPLKKKAHKKVSEHDRITNLLAGHNLWLILSSFLGFGLLLAFTPCVLPMIPILSGLIVGHEKHMTTWHAFWLSFTYVLGMAVTYALLGVAAGFAGHSIQAALQTPAVLVTFSAIFVLLAFSLFGFYEIRLPSRFEDRLTDISNHQKSGNFIGVAIMGVLATLIVSPCITPPLIGALAYIGKTGDSVLGGMALFALGIGMGIPLIIIGTSHGKLLPKAGAWMDAVKAFFGALLLATAIWMIARVIPAQITMFLWAGLLLVSAVYMGLLSPHNHSGWGNFWRGLGFVIAVYGIILMIGGAMGNTNPLQPLKAPISHAQAAVKPSPLKLQPMPAAPLLKSISDNQAFDRALKAGTDAKQITMLDFFADWCISCKEMDVNVFADPEVRARLSQFNVLQSDVTANDIDDKAIQERFNVIAPPTILFFDADGNELKDFRIVGEMDKQTFLAHLDELADNQ